VTQLNTGKKTAGLDGKAFLTFQERFELEERLRTSAKRWQHGGLRAISIPKKDGTNRILKVPNLCDRAWQCLIKYALEGAHEAVFHERSYGFRPGRSAHDCQKIIFNHLRSFADGRHKRILELDIEKCFDRIGHPALMSRVIAPQSIKTGLWKCLHSVTMPEFPEQGVPQGGCVSPLLANIALNGIEAIHPSVRYADDMVFFLKPKDDAQLILDQIKQFLTDRGLQIKASKTRLVSAADGFDFLGWHFQVQNNGKFRCTPSKENFQAFRAKVKSIVNRSNYGARVKAAKLAPVVRGWRNYHRYCKMDGSRFSLWFINHRAFKVFLKETKMSRDEAEKLIKTAFPRVRYAENRFVSVKGDASPFNGDLVYWSKRESKHYDGITAKTLLRQMHTCGHCGLRFVDGERIHLHHVNGNHEDWKPRNLLAVHQSCHQYIHMSKSER
jgi:group II intron reverse transcriptase/maturase